VTEWQYHIDKARTALTEGRYLLAGGYGSSAGRDAYMAGFHAAVAYVVQRTGKRPKTHSGARSEFARLARDDQRLSQSFPTFLAHGFEVKTSADYTGSHPLTVEEAQRSLAQAEAMVDAIAALLAAEDG
jgi:uncharacterized protein (UPF0332 family)